MEFVAQSKNVRISPRKARQLVRLVKKMSLSSVQTQLRFLTKKGAKPILKTLESALANAKNNKPGAIPESADNLKIKDILVDEGNWYGRKYDTSHGARFGLSMIKRRASHIKVILTDKNG